MDHHCFVDLYLLTMYETRRLHLKLHRVHTAASITSRNYVPKLHVERVHCVALLFGGAGVFEPEKVHRPRFRWFVGRARNVTTTCLCLLKQTAVEMQLCRVDPACCALATPAPRTHQKCTTKLCSLRCSFSHR